MSFKDGEVDVSSVLADIERLTAIESPTSHVAGVDHVLDTVAAMFDGTGAELQRQSIDPRFGGMLTVNTTPERRQPGILVLAHCDTVHPLGTLSRDLAIRREGDRLYGPGVFDMKGGLVLAVAGYKRLLAEGLESKLPITFLFTPDEEVGSVASRPYIEAAGRNAKYVLVTEPKRKGGRVVTARKGTGRFEIDAHGRPAHAGTAPQDGRSAIRAMAHTILEIEGWTDLKRGISTNVGLVSGGTGVNVVPAHCRINADVRVVDAEGAREMERRYHALQSRVADVTLSISGGMTRPPWPLAGPTQSLFEKTKTVAAEIGIALASGPLTGGGSDGNFTAALGVPTLDGLGVEGEGAHTLHEHMLISSIEPGVRLFQGLFERLE